MRQPAAWNQLPCQFRRVIHDGTDAEIVPGGSGTRGNSWGCNRTAKQSSSAPDPAKKEIPPFRFPFDAQPPRKSKGGNNSKEVTVRELPISTGMAGVSMRLEPGGMRELHWHTSSEWAYMVKGQSAHHRDCPPDGTSETNDFEPGDVWFFPPGHAHSLQGMGTEQSHFILVFNDGNFSETSTFSITDWIGQTPHEVLSKVFSMPESELAKFPKEEVYFARGPVPPAEIALPLSGGLKTPSATHKFSLATQVPRTTHKGGSERRVTVKEFPIATTTSGVLLDLAPGAVREPHWHPNADEWQFLVSGHVRIGAFAGEGRSRVESFNPGDAGYIPRMYGHYIENASDTEPAQVLVVFNSGEYQAIDLILVDCFEPRLSTGREP